MLPFLIPLLMAGAGLGASAIGARKARKQAKRDAANPPVENVPTMTPQQAAFINALGQMGLTGAQEQYPRVMGDLYQGFDPLETQGRENFMQQQVPGIAEQFSSMGSFGGQRSSAFPQYLGEQSRGLETGLGEQRQAYGMNQLGAQQNFLSLLSGQGLQKQFEPIYTQKAPSPWPGLLGSAIGTLPYFMGNNRMGGR
ncbi:MAG: hypothetical protein EHJ95_04600 [Methanobacteriota archaeon]|nr:MAG: hypothetical protein EHJ95_04600 [Euryarchaeota archaeon]